MPNIQPISILRERELRDLALKVNKSRDSIKEGKFYSEEEVDRKLEIAEVLEHLEIAKLIKEREKEEATISLNEVLEKNGI